jgi:hypothetical protein
MRGWSSGLRYKSSQNANQKIPSPPVITNAQRHPQWTVIHGTTSGVSMAPTLVPAFKIPMASARSFLGNQSATALILAGNKPASQNPKADRATRKLPKELPMACPIEARLQNTIASA